MDYHSSGNFSVKSFFNLADGLLSNHLEAYGFSKQVWHAWCFHSKGKVTSFVCDHWLSLKKDRLVGAT